MEWPRQADCSLCWLTAKEPHNFQQTLSLLTWLFVVHHPAERQSTNNLHSTTLTLLLKYRWLQLTLLKLLWYDCSKCGWTCWSSNTVKTCKLQDRNRQRQNLRRRMTQTFFISTLAQNCPSLLQTYCDFECGPWWKADLALISFI